MDNISNNFNDNKTDSRFSSKNKYFVISCYVLTVVIISSIFIRIIFNLDEFKGSIQNFLSAALPFIIAFFIAYFLNPIVKLVDYYFLEKLLRIKSKKIRVVISIFISYIVFIALIILLLIYVIPELASSLQDLGGRLPKYFSNVYASVNSLFSNTEKRFPELDISYIKDKVEDSLPKLFNISTDIVGTTMTNLISLSFSILTTIYTILISIIISTYMIADKHVLAKNAAKFTYAVLSRKKADNVCTTAKECNIIFYNFVIGKALDSFIIGVITFITMSLLKLEYPMMISIVVGVTNMIPYFGPFIGAIPGFLILLIISPVKAIVFAILILIIQQFDGLYLGPKILGDSVGLSPLWIIFGITLGGSYFGVLGMFLGVPIIAVIAHLLNKLIAYQLNKKKLYDSFFAEYDVDTVKNKDLLSKEYKVIKPTKISFFRNNKKKKD